MHLELAGNRIFNERNSQVQIFYSDKLKKQISKRKDSRRIAEKINDELMTIVNCERESHQDLMQYLKSQNAKKLKGSYKNTFKYRLSDGDRILYTYGRELDYLKDTFPDAMVILAYATHDKQGMVSGYKNTAVRENITHQDMVDWELGTEQQIEEIFDINFANTHRFYVYDNDNIPEFIFEDSDVLLSKTQANIIDTYLKKPTPTLLRGGAGSGKTVMGIHILHDYAIANPNGKCIYFTQSLELIRKAKERYKYIISKDGVHSGRERNIEFFELNEYCLRNLKSDKIGKSSISGFSNFILFLKSCSITIPEGLNIYDLWAEIRGTIKGGLDDFWSRCYPFDQKDFENERSMLPILEEKGWIERLNDNPQLFTVTGEELGTINSTLQEKDFFLRLLSKRKSVDCKRPLRDYREYEQLSEERTTLSTESREQCYSIAQAYQEWMSKNKLYDDNDIILEMLRAGYDTEKYDLIVVDEVQDYTELQLYFIKSLVKSINGLIFAGDVHQIINPTIFSDSRLHSLVKGTGLTEQVVAVNYRCAEQIVIYTNRIANARAKFIAKKSGELEEISYIQGHNPISLMYSDNNIISLLNELIEYPRIAVLVADEQTKNKLISVIGEEKYKEHNMDFIFTIPEIKGMEYRYVVCFDLITTFKDTWTKIIQGDSRKRTKYRYYFNLLYVAFSRAQDSLCIIESGDVDTITATLYGNIEHVTAFDTEKLYIDQLPKDIDEIIAEAEDYFRYGDYARAKQRYIKAGKRNFAREIDRCDIYQYINERQFEKALRKAIIIDDVEIIKTYINEIPKNKNFFQLLEAYVDIEKYTTRKPGARKEVTKLIEKEMPYLTQEEKDSLCERFIKRFDDRIMDLLEQGVKGGIYQL